jgi:hypothetical protein
VLFSFLHTSIIINKNAKIPSNKVKSPDPINLLQATMWSNYNSSTLRLHKWISFKGICTARNRFPKWSVW